MQQFAEFSSPPRVGDRAIDFELPAPVGAGQRLSDLRGTAVVVAFHPPQWDPARQAHVDAHQWLLAGQTNSVNNEPVLIRNDDEVATAYGVRGGSAVFVIGIDGAVAWRYVAGVDTLQPVVTVKTTNGDSRENSNSRVTWSRRAFLATTVATAAACSPASPSR